MEVLKGLDVQALHEDVHNHVLGRTVENFDYLSPNRFLNKMVLKVNGSSMVFIILGNGDS